MQSKIYSEYVLVVCAICLLLFKNANPGCIKCIKKIKFFDELFFSGNKSYRAKNERREKFPNIFSNKHVVQYI